jgi:hypothetical protein
MAIFAFKTTHDSPIVFPPAQKASMNSFRSSCGKREDGPKPDVQQSQQHNVSSNNGGRKDTIGPQNVVDIWIDMPMEHYGRQTGEWTHFKKLG